MIARTRTNSQARSSDRHAQPDPNLAQVLKRDAQEVAASVGALASDQLEPVRDFLLKRPIQSLLLAAGAGVIVGIVMGRR